ncbi:unnamed protein product [Chrysodeixis includens]|uniref:Uncharacterized protein n=1 Tax=Chrysodeixis includens TaxID=689277 RepID=A0A9N8Q1D3_CHRIL|nr:unnamed protein product [Chrysodeixis includens]
MCRCMNSLPVTAAVVGKVVDHMAYLSGPNYHAISHDVNPVSLDTNVLCSKTLSFYIDTSKHETSLSEARTWARAGEIIAANRAPEVAACTTLHVTYLSNWRADFLIAPTDISRALSRGQTDREPTFDPGRIDESLFCETKIDVNYVG